MGRRRWTDRMTVEDCIALDMWVLKRTICQRSDWRVYRWPDTGRAVSPEVGYRVAIDAANRSSLFLRYTVSDNGVQSRILREYQVQTATTPCRFGGRRYWFVCPLVRKGVPCLRRVRKLFLPPGAVFFGCRRCYNLTYRSAQEHDKRVDAILRLPIKEFQKVLHDDTMRFGTLASRAGAVLRRRV
jgi:hypothetical protein